MNSSNKLHHSTFSFGIMSITGVISTNSTETLMNLFFLDHHLLKTPYLIKEKPSVLITTYPCIVVSKFSAIVDTTTSIWVSLQKTI